jgi:hypothetical protein
VNGFRILLLRAVRLVRRGPMRSLTTGLLVVAAVLAGSLWLSESQGHYEANSSVESQLGQADVRYNLWLEEGMDPIAGQVATVLEALPEGADAVVIETIGEARVGATAWSDSLSVQQGPWNDPLLDGMVDLAAGRLPGPGEVVVPPSIAVSAGVDIGDQLVILEPVAVLDVVGLGSTGNWPQLLVAEDEFVLTETQRSGAAPTFAGAMVLAALPPGESAPKVASSFERASWFNGQPPTGVSTAVVVLTLSFVGLTAGAAFGIGAARRRRALGLLAANGATAGQLRLSAGAEALVVSAPAVVVGAVAAILLPPVWVQLRLPGWDRIWQFAAPLPWVAVLAVAAVAAAVLGTLAFSGSAGRTPVPALLDSRPSARASRPAASGRRGWWILAAIAVLAVLAVPVPALLVGLTRSGRSAGVLLGLLVALVAWCVGVAAIVTIARWALGRHTLGRLVGRDLARRPMGTAAAVIVIALWSFGAGMVALTSGWGGYDVGEPTSSPLEPPVPQQATTTGAVTIQPPASAAVRHRSAADVDTRSLPVGLREDLAELGLATQPATIGVFTGPCEACPSGYRPSVMVLDSLDGLGLPAETEVALRSGSVVTEIELDGLDGSTIDGRRITVAPLPFNANAAMLREFATGETMLEEQVEALVGSTDGLTDSDASGVVAAVAAAGLQLVSDDLRLRSITYAEASGLGLTGPPDRTMWWWAASVAVVALVTLTATAAHRREHSEAADVLGVLGAGPGANRRLAALTAGTIATIGVLLGTTTAVVIAVSYGFLSTDLDSTPVGPGSVLAVLGMVVAVPASAALLGRLLPPARSTHVEVRPA